MRKLLNKIRHYWHELYYWKADESRVQFALTCREVALQIDGVDKKRNFVFLFRFYLHISVCQACANYKRFSDFLKIKIQKIAARTVLQKDIRELNERLLKIHKDKSN